MSESFQYEIVACVGRGSYGDVYEGLDLSTGEVIGIKVINVESIENDIQEINQEVQALTECKCKNIASYYGSSIKPNTLELYVVMEPMACSILDIIRSGPMDEQCIAYVLRETLQALSYLHSQNHIHRDIKAANVFVSSRGEIKFLDFGICGQTSSTSNLKRRTFADMPFWMAPEVIWSSEEDYSQFSDIWSLGITAIEMATSNPPLSHMPPVQALLAIPKAPAPVLEGPFSSAFKEFVADCLQKDPSARATAIALLKHPFIAEAEQPPYFRDIIVETSMRARATLATTNPLLKESNGNPRQQINRMEGGNGVLDAKEGFQSSNTGITNDASSASAEELGEGSHKNTMNKTSVNDQKVVDDPEKGEEAKGKGSPYDDRGLAQSVSNLEIGDFPSNPRNFPSTERTEEAPSAGRSSFISSEFQGNLASSQGNFSQIPDQGGADRMARNDPYATSSRPVNNASYNSNRNDGGPPYMASNPSSTMRSVAHGATIRFAEGTRGEVLMNQMPGQDVSKSNYGTMISNNNGNRNYGNGNPNAYSGTIVGRNHPVNDFNSYNNDSNSSNNINNNVTNYGNYNSTVGYNSTIRNPNFEGYGSTLVSNAHRGNSGVLNGNGYNNNDGNVGSGRFGGGGGSEMSDFAAAISSFGGGGGRGGGGGGGIGGNNSYYNNGSGDISHMGSNNNGNPYSTVQRFGGEVNNNNNGNVNNNAYSSTMVMNNRPVLQQQQQQQSNYNYNSTMVFNKSNNGNNIINNNNNSSIAKSNPSSSPTQPSITSAVVATPPTSVTPMLAPIPPLAAVQASATSASSSDSSFMLNQLLIPAFHNSFISPDRNTQSLLAGLTSSLLQLEKLTPGSTSRLLHDLVVRMACINDPHMASLQHATLALFGGDRLDSSTANGNGANDDGADDDDGDENMDSDDDYDDAKGNRGARKGGKNRNRRSQKDKYGEKQYGKSKKKSQLAPFLQQLNREREVPVKAPPTLGALGDFLLKNWQEEEAHEKVLLMRALQMPKG